MRSNLYRKEFMEQDPVQMFKTIMIISTVIMDNEKAAEMASNGLDLCKAGFVSNGEMLLKLTEVSKLTPTDVVVYLQTYMPGFMNDLVLPFDDLIQGRLDAIKDLLVETSSIIQLKASGEPLGEA